MAVLAAAVAVLAGVQELLAQEEDLPLTLAAMDNLHRQVHALADLAALTLAAAVVAKAFLLHKVALAVLELW